MGFFELFKIIFIGKEMYLTQDLYVLSENSVRKILNYHLNTWQKIKV